MQTGRRRRLLVPGVGDLLGYKAMLADFFEAIRHNRPPAYTLALAERDLRLVEDAYASLNSLTRKGNDVATDCLIAAGLGMLAGLHTATWGMYKDSIHEGFFWPRYFRSPIVGIVMAVIAYVDRAARARYGGRPWSRSLAWSTCWSAALIELWKTFLRNEDQSKYFIPMQFAVFGKVVQSQSRRLHHRRHHDGGRLRHVPAGALRRAATPAAGRRRGWCSASRPSADGSPRFSARGKTRRSKAFSR